MTLPNLPRFVYHGTDAEAVETVLEEGLQPRNATEKSNWSEKDVPSLPDHVYLTSMYAPHFGDAARDSSDEPIAIFEVDLHSLNRDMDLFPDEDFIEQSLRGGSQSLGADEFVEVPPFLDIDLTGDMSERTAQIRDHITAFRPYWEMSLAVMGNISHRGEIPPESIRRVSVVEMPPSFRVTILGDGPSIINSVVANDKHKLITEWMMGEDVTAEELANASLHGTEPSPGIVDQFDQLLDPAILEVKENPSY